ncbi:MAG: hypothetical protein E3K37_03630 [Candidatus Kuenenia sp.]|nr:hypothetical protein [Candidatus Kuenenia hertensis]
MKNKLLLITFFIAVYSLGFITSQLYKQNGKYFSIPVLKILKGKNTKGAETSKTGKEFYNDTDPLNDLKGLKDDIETFKVLIGEVMKEVYNKDTENVNKKLPPHNLAGTNREKNVGQGL